MIKRARGRANHSSHVLGMDYWNKFNLNDEKDKSIDRYKTANRKLVKELKADKVLGELHEKAVEWHQRKAAAMKMDPEMDDLTLALQDSVNS